MSSLKLVSVNIELDKHLDLVRGFLAKEKPDVVCLQEVFEADLDQLAKEFNMQAVFGQMSSIGKKDYNKPPFFPYGVGILSELSIKSRQKLYYSGSEEMAKTRQFKDNSREDGHLLVVTIVQKGEINFTIGTTHFTWSADGQADDLQKKDARSLLAVAKEFPELMMVGDFNAPRGGETFASIAKQYTDNIPIEYTTSIDADLHRDKEKIREKSLMVDGLFTTKQYECKNVRLQNGISDHMAIVADVYKKQNE